MTDGRWQRHGRRAVYESAWVNLYVDNVRLPDGQHIDHHVITFPRPGHTVVVLDEVQDSVLLIWRHRFIPDAWAWETPGGWAEPGEDPEATVRRELLEETGYRVRTVAPMAAWDVCPGVSTMRLTSWLATGPRLVGDPPDTNEVNRVAWHPVASIPELVRDHAIREAGTITALTYYLMVHSGRTLGAAIR